MQSQRLGSSLFQSLEAVGRWPIKGPGTRTPLFRKPRSQRETGSAAGKKDMVRRGPGKGLLRWAASPQLGSPSLRHSYRGIQTLWLARLPHQCPVAALSLSPTALQPNFVLSLTSPLGLCLYVFSPPEVCLASFHSPSGLSSQLTTAEWHPVNNPSRVAAATPLFTYHRIPVSTICLLADHMSKWSPPSSSQLGYELSKKGTWLSCSALCPTTWHGTGCLNKLMILNLYQFFQMSLFLSCLFPWHSLSTIHVFTPRQIQLLPK